jgi:hypothetical protein
VGPGGAGGRAVSGVVQGLGGAGDRHPVDDEESVHLADAGGLGWVDVQHHTASGVRVGDGPVAERGYGFDEPAVGDPVADPVVRAFPDAFTFELGEHAEQLQHQPAGRGAGVQAVPDADHPDPEGVQLLHQGEQVQQVAAQPVQLGDQQRVEPAGRGRCCQLIQRGTRGPGAGDTSIDILADQGQAVQLGGRLTTARAGCRSRRRGPARRSRPADTSPHGDDLSCPARPPQPR